MKTPTARGRRDKHIAKVFLPLMIGYKAATLLMGAVIIVSGILLKSILAAKVALLLTGTVLLKKLFSSNSEESHKIHLFPVYEEVHPYSTHKISGIYKNIKITYAFTSNFRFWNVLSLYIFLEILKSKNKINESDL